MGNSPLRGSKDGNGDIKREKQYLKTGKCKPRREGKVVDEIWGGISGSEFRQTRCHRWVVKLEVEIASHLALKSALG